MNAEKLLDIIGADFYTGVPDSQLKALCNCLMNKYGIDPKHHIIAANEGNCTALAAGYHLATGKVPVVYMQNSGEGNTRILFMKKRNRCFMTLKGRLILLFSIYTYIKIYKKNALTIYITDLTIGLDDFVKNKIKGVLNSLSFTF